VHGLNEDSYETWSNGSQNGFWPGWLAEDCPNLDVWYVGYQVAARGGHGAAMPLVYRADNVLTAMKDKGLGTKPLCFITHSMGGLLVKWMLRRAEYDEGFKSFCEVTRGVVFLSTPHTGSGLAKLAEYFNFLRFTVAVQELKEYATPLVELREWYIWKVKQLHIGTQVFYENIPTKRGPFQAIVVDRASADPGIPEVRPIAVDADHNDICRFPSRDYYVYGRIKDFALEVLTLARGNDIQSDDQSDVRLDGQSVETIRQVLGICYRQSIFANQHSEVSYAAMLRSLAQCRAELQRIVMSISSVRARGLVAEIIDLLHDIEREDKKFESLHGRDRASLLDTIDGKKLRINEALEELAQMAGISYPRPTHFMRLRKP